MSWIHEEFERANVRRFRRALAEAKAEFERLPKYRQEILEREFQAAAEAARHHATYNPTQ